MVFINTFWIQILRFETTLQFLIAHLCIQMIHQMLRESQRNLRPSNYKRLN